MPAGDLRPAIGLVADPSRTPLTKPRVQTGFPLWRWLAPDSHHGLGGTDLVTTLPAVTIAPRPMATFGNTITPTPSTASSTITTPSSSRLWAMMVTRIPIAARSRIVTRCGQDVSMIVSYPIHTSLPMSTPRLEQHARSCGARCNSSEHLKNPIF